MSGTSVDADRTRWLMLVIGSAGQVAAALVVQGVAFLIPEWTRTGLSLAEAGALSSTPTVGALLSLLPWGVAADRFGERATIAVGLSVSVLALGTGSMSDSTLTLAVALTVAGAGTASVNVATSRLVIGWFPPHQRGLAMGIRQVAPITGVGIAALSLPAIAGRWGIESAILAAALPCALALVVSALFVREPPRDLGDDGAARAPRTGDNPYRGDRLLVRVHTASALLVIPQITIWTFAFVWLTDELHWSNAAAGITIALTHVAGAVGRIALGIWSDRVASRLGPLRLAGGAAAVSMVAFGLLASTSAGIVLLCVAAVATVAHNALGFTAVAEMAGLGWSGRSMAIHNASLLAAAVAVPPVGGYAIDLMGYNAAFATCAVFPALALIALHDGRGRLD